MTTASNPIAGLLSMSASVPPGTSRPVGGDSERSERSQPTNSNADTPPVEKEIAFDIVKKAPIAAPFVIAGAAVFWGVHGAETAAVAVAVVCVNLVLAALSLAWAAKLGPTVLMGTALGGFLVRMGLVTVVCLAVRHQPWANLTALAVTILVTHLGLLAWETKYVSATLAYPGLAPKKENGR